MFKLIFLTVALVVLIDLHCAEGNLSGKLSKGSHKKSSSSNVVVVEESAKCKSGNCKHESGWESSNSEWKGSESGRKSHHKSKSGSKGKRRSCSGSNCCKGNSCNPVYPVYPPPLPPVQTMAPATSTMAPATTPPYQCPTNSQLIRVTGGEASIPDIIDGISAQQGVSMGDISLNITDPTGQIIGICFSQPICPVGTAVVNLNGVSQDLVLSSLVAVRPVIIRTLTDSKGRKLAVCVSAAVCPANTLLINISTVKLDGIAEFLASLGFSLKSVSETVYDSNGIPAGFCIRADNPCPRNTLLLPSGSMNQSLILDAIAGLGDNVASIIQSAVDPLTRDPLGVCISANANTDLTIGGIIKSLIYALHL